MGLLAVEATLLVIIYSLGTIEAVRYHDWWMAAGFCIATLFCAVIGTGAWLESLGKMRASEPAGKNRK